METNSRKKIIFLDIDGVLNTKWWYTQMDRNTPKDKYGYAFDPRAVANLKRIVEETEADIVISSSWKFMGLDELRAMWKERGLPGSIIDVTPNGMCDEVLLTADLDNMGVTRCRGNEIKEWLMQNSGVTHYAILDDMNDILQEQESHFIWIDPVVGITTENVVQTVMTLNCVN